MYFTIANFIYTELSTLQRYMYGQGSQRKAAPAYAFSMASWTVTCFATSLTRRSNLPFLEKWFPTSHRVLQDNDPKHTSVYAKEFMESHQINWWKTPAESPDLNLIENLWHEIENLWHEMKEFNRREVKPTVNRWYYSILGHCYCS